MDFSSHTRVYLSDDSCRSIGYLTFPFYSAEAQQHRVYACDNGYVNFNSSSVTFSRNWESFYGSPRFAPMFVDLDPPEDGGKMYAFLDSEMAVVTWDRVYNWPGKRDYNPTPNTFQAIIHANGTMEARCVLWRMRRSGALLRA
eukprot:scaffold3597_cov395-Prasinococcus_capsulatus_cf.AAC.6